MYTLIKALLIKKILLCIFCAAITYFSVAVFSSSGRGGHEDYSLFFLGEVCSVRMSLTASVPVMSASSHHVSACSHSVLMAHQLVMPGRAFEIFLSLCSAMRFCFFLVFFLSCGEQTAS